MNKVGVLVCGNSGIDYIKHDYDIEVIRSILFVGENEYEDFVDITADEFYKMLEDNPELTPTTAQAATGVIIEQYRDMFNKGYDELFVITVSQHLSGTYSGCILATKEFPDKKITVYDSKTVSYPEAKMALEAARLFKDNTSTEEVVKELDFIRDNSMIWFSVNTLKYLVKNGRLSGAAGFVGSLMKIKPMLEVTKDGYVKSIEKIRTSSKAINRVIEKYLEEISNKNVEAFTINSNNPERVEFIQDKIKNQRKDIKNMGDYPLTPVVGAHAGPHVVGVGYILKDRWLVMNAAQKVINDLLVEIFHHILSIEGAMLREKGVPLSMSEVHVLEAITKTETPTMGNIASKLRVTVGTLTTAINRLVTKGYVDRKREKDDKRKVLVFLTPKAYDVLKIHDEFHEDMIGSVIKDMKLGEDEVLIKSLQNISNYFTNKY